MAKFKGKDLYLADDDQIYFGDNQEAAMWYDADDELHLNHTLSGVQATEGHHMVRYDQLTDEFIQLSDTPATYSGSEGYAVAVNASGTGLVFSQAVGAFIIESPTPPDPDDANLWYNTTINDIFYYDPSRNSWLTTTSHNYMFSRSGAVGGSYLAIDAVVDSSAHYWIPRNASITGVIINMQETLNSSKSFEVRDWATTISGGTFTTTNYVYHAFDVDVAVASGTRMRCFVDNIGQNIKNPIVIFELRWRYDVI